MGATAIGVLVRANNYLRGSSGDLTVRFASPVALRLLDLCGLADLVEPG